jgi:hypothetical protein
MMIQKTIEEIKGERIYARTLRINSVLPYVMGWCFFAAIVHTNPIMAVIGTLLILVPALKWKW